MTGSVTLYDYNGNPLRQFNYSSRPHRNKLLEAFKFLYGKHLNDYYYQILPHISTVNIDESGTNLQAPSNRKRMRSKYLSGIPKVAKPKNYPTFQE